MDLGGRYEIRSIATRGLSTTKQFVTEYIVQFSDDGEGWRSFTDPQGEIEVLLVSLLMYEGVKHGFVLFFFKLQSLKPFILQDC